MSSYSTGRCHPSKCCFSCSSDTNDDDAKSEIDLADDIDIELGEGELESDGEGKFKSDIDSTNESDHQSGNFIIHTVIAFSLQGLKQVA